MCLYSMLYLKDSLSVLSEEDLVSTETPAERQSSHTRQISHLSDFQRLTTPGAGASPFVLSATQNLRVETLLDSELGPEHLLSPKMAQA